MRRKLNFCVFSISFLSLKPKENFKFVFSVCFFFLFPSSISRINRRLVASLNPSSSEDGIGESDAHAARKKLRKRRKMRAVMAKSQLQGIEAISDGDTDEAVDINDSDCSESQIQSAMLGHLHAKAPFINTMTNNHLIGMLSGGENDGSYSSPLSQKSGKNMADFDDDDSPCEEELAQLAASSHCLAAFAASSRERNITQNVLNSVSNALTAKSSRNSSRTTENARTNLMTANEVSQPCNILLWDLLMDDKIVSFQFSHKTINLRKKKLTKIFIPI